VGTPYIGEIRMFAGTFAPAGWAFCDGSLVPISENDALFTLIGTTYGGDGQETFALPNLRGRIPVHMGQGPGLTGRVIGESGGTESVTLTTAQIPAHSHGLDASTNVTNGTYGLGKGVPGNTGGSPIYGDMSVSVGDMKQNVIGINSGGSQPHSNMGPYLCLSFIISLFGVFPTQN